jgi:hypothetical protein
MGFSLLFGILRCFLLLTGFHLHHNLTAFAIDKSMGNKDS